MTPSLTDEGAQRFNFADQVTALATGEFEEKAITIAALGASGDERAITILRALLNGSLYVRKEDGRVVTTQEVEDGFQLADAVSGEAMGQAGRRDVKKISINNALRGQLRGAIAHLSLSHKSAKVRLAAVREIIKDMDEETAALLRNAERSERDEDVLAVLNAGIALGDIGSADKTTRLRAIAILGREFAA